MGHKPKSTDSPPTSSATRSPGRAGDSRAANGADGHAAPAPARKKARAGAGGSSGRPPAGPPRAGNGNGGGGGIELDASLMQEARRRYLNYA